MQRLDLKQLLSQKLSPQQIQFIKLLQIPTAELDTRIKEELEVNPALEEDEADDTPEEAERDDDDGDDSDDPDAEFDNPDNTLDEDFDGDAGSSEQPEIELPTPKEDDGPADTAETADSAELDLSDYLHDDEIAGYKMQGDGPGEEEEREMPLADNSASLHDALLDQLGFANLDERQQAIGEQLIGSIDGDGYIRRDLAAIANDLAFSRNIEATVPEIEAVLRVIQGFDPPGIAARDLPECLILQLERRPPDEATENALRIIEQTFEEFSKKHYARIQQKLDLEEDELKEAIGVILKLNPKPGGTGPTGTGRGGIQYLMPDFILTNDNGQLSLTLNARNAPELRVSPAYTEMFRTYDKAAKKDKKMKEAVTFVKQKLDSAKWFIDAIRQRQNTLLRTMNAIVELQREFFVEGDETKLRPMILKDIAQKIDMDISTVSRVANSKSVQTEFGIYPLKYFFSEGIATDSGEDASSREVKSILKDLIEKESKERPLSDDKLEKMLNARGYNIARRTVAKYREQLNLPVARLRKEL